MHAMIKQKLGEKQYQILTEIKQQIKIRNGMIRRAKQQYLERKAASTITRNRSKQWYNIVHQMGGLYKSSQLSIDRIIYPKVATKHTPDETKR